MAQREIKDIFFSAPLRLCVSPFPIAFQRIFNKIRRFPQTTPETFTSRTQ